MPSLRILSMDEDDRTELNKILRSFICPSLTEFSLTAYGNWTSDTIEILNRQYNMQELRDVQIAGNFVLPVSPFLREAPMLHSFSLQGNAIMDDEAIVGISNGTLGRFLRALEIGIDCDAEEVLGMVGARKKTVDG